MKGDGNGNGGGKGSGNGDGGGDPLSGIYELGELALIATLSAFGGALFTEAIRRFGGVSATWGPTIAIPAAAIVMSVGEGWAEIAAGWFALGATAACGVRIYLATSTAAAYGSVNGGGSDPRSWSAAYFGSELG